MIPRLFQNYIFIIILSLFFIQFTVTVKDKGTPELVGTNTATVTVTVHRNLNDPELNLPATADINRQANDNDVVTTFNPRDVDDRVG